MASIIAGNATSSLCSNCDINYYGVAPKANINNLRALDANGQASDSTVIAAIQQAIALKSQYNIRVINLSLGRGIFESYKLDPCVRQSSKPGRLALSWWSPRVITAAIIPTTIVATEPSRHRATIPT